MPSTTTYTKRHRRKNRVEASTTENNLYTIVDAPDNNPTQLFPPKKRGRHPQEDIESIDEPRKKSKKPRKMSSMSVHSLQTPLPTLQGQSQVYKLPSSSPKASPGIFSPVPDASRMVLISSKKLKENQPRRSANGNKSWRTSSYRNSSKTLRSSVTLASGVFSPEDVSGPALHGPSHPQDRSRSTSRSSTSSAVSITLKDSQKFNSTLKYSQSLTSLKLGGKLKKRQKQKQKAGKNKRSLVMPLASPFVSRSSSPSKIRVDADMHSSGEDDSNLALEYTEHISMGPPLPSRKNDVGPPNESKLNNRVGLSDTYFDPNIPSCHRGDIDNGGFQSITKTSPHKMAKPLSRLQSANITFKTKRESTLGLPIDALVPALEEVRYLQKRRKAENKRKVPFSRERRTSAPSTLQLPRMQRTLNVGSAVSHTVGGAAAYDHGLAELQKVRLATGLDIILDPRSYHSGALVSSDEAEDHGPGHLRNNPSPLKWMQARGGVDFNRPPSQMSLDSGYGFEYPDVEATDVFTSSEEDVNEKGGMRREGGENGCRQDFTRGKAPIAREGAGHRLGVPFCLELAPVALNFGEDAWAASTPFKHPLLDMGQKPNRKPRARLNLADNGYETDLNVVASVKKRRLEQEKHKSYEHGSIPLVLTRTFSLPNLKSSPDGLTTLSSSLGLGSTARIRIRKSDYGCGDEREEQEGDEEGEKDMDLTGSEIKPMVVGVEALRECEPESGQDMTSWITDSIISPPTDYVQWAIKRGGGRRCVTSSDGDTNAGSLQGSGGMNQHRNGQILIQLMDDGSSEEVVKEDTFIRATLGNHTLDDHQERCKRGFLKETSEESTTSAALEHEHGPVNAKRTRSGTIVPMNAPIPPGTRRTRGGTIVGPMPVAAPTNPLPSVPIGKSGIGQDSGVIPDVGAAATRRSRSGTITATGSAGTADERTRGGSVQRSKGNAEESHLDGDHVILNQQPRFGGALHDRHYNIEQLPWIDGSTNDVQETQIVEEYEADIKCYVDSMYLPPLTSSPDPIDFLRFASIMEEEEDNIAFTEFTSALGGVAAREIVWRVAEDPPSPEVPKKRSNGIFRGIGFGGKGWSLTGRSGGRKQKSQHKKAKFTEDLVGGEDADEVIGRNGDTELSDDELLLLPGIMVDSRPSR